MRSKTMHHWRRSMDLGLCAACVVAMTTPASAEPPLDGVTTATHVVADDDGDKSQFDQVRLVRELMRRRGGDTAAAAQLIQLTRPFEAAVAAEMFDVLADAHLAEGNLDLAAETRRLLVQQYPGEPRARDATLWLVRLYASSEVTHAHRQRTAAAGRGGDDAAVDQGFAMYALNLAASDEDLTTTRKRDPALSFQRAVAARRAEQGKVSDAFLTSLKRLRAGDPWGECARAEAWLAERGDGQPPKPLARCIDAAERPRLDGVLDDPCWLGDAGFPLTAAGAAAAAGDATGLVRLAYDGEYLYLAATCPKRPGVAYPVDERPRPRDSDLSTYDRVRLLIDADRDYATWFELTIDSRGWTADRCWVDAAWNPKWFVAAAHRADAPRTPWAVEAAIPWTALAARAPQSGEAWAIAVDRLAPDAEAQAWQKPAGEHPGPASFGLLLFD